MIMMKTEQRQREDDESKQEWHRELKKGNVIQIICNVFIYIVDFLPRLFASYYVLACEKFPNKSKSFVKHSFYDLKFLHFAIFPQRLFGELRNRDCHAILPRSPKGM